MSTGYGDAGVGSPLGGRQGSIERMFDMVPSQPTLFGGGAPRHDSEFGGTERIELADGAWLDVQRGWLDGDESLFAVLRERVAWEQPELRMYDRIVKTPRLVGRIDTGLHPEIEAMSESLSRRYDVPLDRLSAGYYRNGSDSVAWHGDRIARDLAFATVATVSLGGPRTFLARPVAGGSSLRWSLGRGDLVVMGGSFQRTWRHSVPKAASAPPRIALMFRHR